VGPTGGGSVGETGFASDWIAGTTRGVRPPRKSLTFPPEMGWAGLK
jgi:hypothetical protein